MSIGCGLKKIPNVERRSAAAKIGNEEQTEDQSKEQTQKKRSEAKIKTEDRKRSAKPALRRPPTSPRPHEWTSSPLRSSGGFLPPRRAPAHRLTADGAPRLDRSPFRAPRSTVAGSAPGGGSPVALLRSSACRASSKVTAACAHGRARRDGLSAETIFPELRSVTLPPYPPPEEGGSPPAQHKESIMQHPRPRTGLRALMNPVRVFPAPAGYRIMGLMSAPRDGALRGLPLRGTRAVR